MTEVVTQTTTEEQPCRRGGLRFSVEMEGRGLRSSSRGRNSLHSWEDGVAVLESILLSESGASLLESQKEDLRRVQKLLMSGPMKRRESRVPIELLSDSPDAGSASDYILAAFAGIHRSPVRNKVMKVVNAQRFVSHMVKITSGRRLMDGNIEAYLIPEWTKLELCHQKELTEMLSWESLQKWDFDIFDLDRLTQGQPLLFVGWAILASPYSQWAMQYSLKEALNDDTILTMQRIDDMPGYDFIDQFKIPQVNLANFLREVERHYVPTNPYHNNTHAADVVQSLHFLLSGTNAQAMAVSELELFAILLSAVVHDMGHPGKSNLFQTNTYSDVAIVYNDMSVLENLHASLAFQLLLGSEKSEGTDIFAGMSRGQTRAIRKLVISGVLGTDMVHHFESVDKVNAILLSAMADGEEDDQDIFMNTNPSNQRRKSWNSTDRGGNQEVKKPSLLKSDDAWYVLVFALHAADLSNPAKPTHLAIQWTDRCLDESFAQGDIEKELDLPISPLCDRATTKRADCQIGFIRFVVAPAYEILAKFVPEVEERILPQIQANLEYWKREKEVEGSIL